MTKMTQQRINDLEIENAMLRNERPSLRDQFAMAALTGILISAGWTSRPIQSFAKIAYDLANVMLEARNDEKD